MAFFARHWSVLTLVVIGAVAIGPGPVARAQDRLEAPSSQHYSFDFQGVTLKDALERLVDSTRISLVYDLDMVEDKHTACRIEKATAEAVLHCIVRGTGLDLERLSSGTFVLRKARRQMLPPVLPRKHIISGFVYDAASGTSLSRAHVYEAERRLGTTTDTSGYYRLGVWLDSVRLAVSHLGYERARLALTLRGDTVRHVGLSPSLLWLDSLTVVAEWDEDDEHPTRGRALYGHVRGVYLGVVGPSVIQFGSREGLVLGYRFRGAVDLGLFLSKREGWEEYILGPVLGFATRPSKQGWGGRARLIYRASFADRRTFGGSLIVRADTLIKAESGSINIRDDTLVFEPFSGTRTEPGILGVNVRDLGLDADVSIYRRFKLDGTAEAFPSIGLFMASSTIRDLEVRKGGLQITLPIIFGLNSRTRLVFEPIFRVSPFRSGLRDGWSVDMRLNL